MKLAFILIFVQCYAVAFRLSEKPRSFSSSIQSQHCRRPLTSIFYSSMYTNDNYSDMKITVLGGGAFSLALVKVLSDKNITTNLLVRNQTIADHINHHHNHPKYLSDFTLPLSLYATTDPVEALRGAKFVIHAVPMQNSRDFLLKTKPYLPVKTPILSVTKGVEIGTFSLMNDIMVETLGSDRRFAFLSGPSFAKEIMQGKPAAVVIASNDDPLSSELAEILSSKSFRCHTSRDVLGVELGGAVKNVIALAAGMCEGLDLGMNAMSSLVTRGCVEMGRYLPIIFTRIIIH